MFSAQSANPAVVPSCSTTHVVLQRILLFLPELMAGELKPPGYPVVFYPAARH